MQQQPKTHNEIADEIASKSVVVLLKSEAIALLKKIVELGIEFAALDFETTALSPDYGRVRLTTIYHPQLGKPYILDHYFCGTFQELCNEIAAVCTWVVFNAKFEVRWFDAATRSDNPVDLVDADFVRKTRMGGGPWGLARVVKVDMGIELDKTEQVSDWNKKALTGRQYLYAGKDAVATWMLFDNWLGELPRSSAGEVPLGFYAFNESVRATVECEDCGMDLDVEYHKKNIARWKMKRDIALSRLRRITPESAIANLNSQKQVHDYLMKALPVSVRNIWPTTGVKKYLAQDAATLRTIARRVTYPLSRWLVALGRHNYYNKYLSTYGETLITKYELEGRITYRLNIAQAATGRYSSSGINIQNVPNAAYVRKAFKPLKDAALDQDYAEFVTADYSGIEIRVLAAISGDEKLMYDAVYGNLHASMAAEANGIPEVEFMERLAEHDPAFVTMRRQAKPGTFRITYGAGVAAVADSLRSSIAYAETFVKKWAERYPVAYNYRNIIFDQMNNDGFIPLADGRTIYVPKLDRTLPVAANYGVQGAAATVMLRAEYHWMQLRSKEYDKRQIRMCASVHDELVTLIGDVKYRPAAYLLLKESMEQGWLDVFPGTTVDNLIEIGHGQTWGDCK